MNPQTDSITTLLFDWDGTVVDSHHLGLRAFEQSFAMLGIDFNQETYRQVYSPNWYTVYEAMGLPREKWERADELWTQNYGAQTAQLVDSAHETLTTLHDRGYRLGVVSSGSDCRVRREIVDHSLENLFSVVVCNEQMENKKPHPEGLQIAMQALEQLPEECCYIGDSPEDIQMGKRAGMVTVGVRSSYPTSWKLGNENPDIFLNAFSELGSHFKS